MSVNYCLLQVLHYLNPVLIMTYAKYHLLKTLALSKASQLCLCGNLWSSPGLLSHLFENGCRLLDFALKISQAPWN